MPGWLTWMVGVGLVVAESALLGALGIDQFSLQTAVAMTLFLALRRPFVSGALVLAALLVPIDWLVAGPPGYYALSLVVVFLGLRLARGRVDSQWGLSQAILAMVAVVVQSGMMAAALMLFEPDAELFGPLMWATIPGAVAAAVTAWPIGALLERADSAVDSRASRRFSGPT